MEIIIFLIGLGIIFLPLVFAGSLLRDETPMRTVIGQTMFLSLMVGGMLQAAVGVNPHVGVSLLVLTVYVGANFIFLMFALGLRAIGNARGMDVEQPADQPIERDEYEQLLFRYEDERVEQC